MPLARSARTAARPVIGYELTGRVAVVTGGAKGLGYSIAERILLSGGAVCLWDVDTAALTDAAKRLARQGRIGTSALDLTESAAVQAATDQTVARFGKIDILINNAGITGGNAAAWDIDPSVWRRVIEVNLVGSFLTSRSVIPVMLRHEYGRIVNVASIAGKEGNPNASHYSASKAGLIALTLSLIHI